MNNSHTGFRTLNKSIIAALGVGFCSSAFSASWLCTNTDDWNNSACWSTPSIPGATETALIQAAPATDIVINYNNSTTPNEMLDEIVLDAEATGTATLIRNDNFDLNSLNVFIGQRGAGVSSVIQNSGSSDFDIGSLGVSAGSTGYYELNGTASLQWRILQLGGFGSGEFVQSGGNHVINGDFQIGGAGIPSHSATSSGRYTLNGGTLTANGVEDVGRWGSGVFIQNGGTHNVRLLHISRKAGDGLYEMNDGVLSVTERLEVGTIPASNGVFVQNGGSVTVGGSTIISANGHAAGSYQLNGGTLQTTDVRNKRTFIHTGGQLIGDLDNYDQVVFSGAGTRLIQGSVTNQGESHFDQPPFGIRTANSSITLSEGTTLQITDNLTLNDLGSFTLELGGDSFGLDNFVQVGGLASLGGTLELDIFSDFLAEDGDSWTLFSASNISGFFSEALLNENFVDLQFSLSYSATSVDLIASSVAPVPVPAAVWLFGTGLAGIVTVSRRGRKAASKA
ncbi:MAG: hypothetical protein JAY71_17240 [Candidatus Thiodiazotropha weberae]|nr:hypothetical protein [Candidatus Thiodiazotropha weberae]